jgi:hypothetical protein
MFTAQLSSNERGADHRKHFYSVSSRVRFDGNVFVDPLPSNKLFRLSRVMLHYYYLHFNNCYFGAFLN